MNLKLINRIIFILSLSGLCVAGYVLFTWVTGSPIVCISSGCETVRKSPYAWPLGIPFPLFGLIGYLLISVLAFLKTIKPNKEKVLNNILNYVALGGSIFVSYFTFMETFVIKGYCMWCIISSIIMFVIYYLSLRAKKLAYTDNI